MNYEDNSEMWWRLNERSQRESDYIVIRVAPEMRVKVPSDLDGRWYDRRDIPAAPISWPLEGSDDQSVGIVAEASGRFEIRDDGAVAEVWEVTADETDSG